MKRVHVENGVYIIIGNSGAIPRRGFEVVKARTIFDFKIAIKLFKKLHHSFDNVYMYQNKDSSFRVEYKGYFPDLKLAQQYKNAVEKLLEEFENGEK